MVSVDVKHHVYLLHFIRSHFFGEHSDLFVSITGFSDLFCLPICIQRVHYLFIYLFFVAMRAEETELPDAHA